MLVTEARRSWPQHLATISALSASGLACGARVRNLPRLLEKGGWHNPSLGIALLCGNIGSLLAVQIVGRSRGQICRADRHSAYLV